jgi:glycosyltransferase involved in cell wall biosynthesis
MPVSVLPREGARRPERPEPVPPGQSAARPLPHICFVAQHAWTVFSGDANIAVVGGAEVQQSILARLFAASGYRVSMICIDYGQPDGVQRDGVTVYRTFPSEAGIPVLRFLHPRLTSLWRAMQRADADIYYQRTTDMATWVVSTFCRRHGRRSIYAGASDLDFVPGGEKLRYARDRWLYRRGVRTVDAIVAQNAVQRETCRKHYAREARIIPSCYQPPQHARRGGDRVLWVGSVDQNKRPEWLLELARRLPHRRFVLVGGPIGGPTGGDTKPQRYYESIRRRAAALPNLEFTGFLPLAEAEHWFDRARMVVSTSRFEGMPNVFLQAWGRGVPVLATFDAGARLGGEPLYRVCGDIDEAAAEIERFHEDAAYWERACARSLEYFRATHSSEEVLARYAALFAELTA